MNERSIRARQLRRGADPAGRRRGAPAQAQVRALAVDRERPSVVYAATYGTSVFKSSTGGD